MGGYKVWADGEDLEAADLNGYLMSQAIPRFASTAERSAAIGDPQLGQFSYVTGIGFQVFTGSVWENVVSAPEQFQMPAGGTTRQVLAKASDDDFDVEFASLNKTDVGLANVDNTADVDKPISTAQQTALDLKADIGSIDKTDVGLGNVDNTSDANKPVSTAQQTALDLKANAANPALTGTVTIGGDTSLFRSSAGVLESNNVTRIVRGSAASATFATAQTGDTQNRHYVSADGTHQWGPGGTGAVDTNLYRYAADLLRTDDSLYVGGSLTVLVSANVYRAAGLNAYSAFISAEAIARLAITTSGVFNFSDGTNAADTNLYRSAAGILRTDNALHVLAGVNSFRTSTGSLSLGAALNTDPAHRLAIFADGKMEWGDGTNARDTNLYRSAANVLRTDDVFRPGVYTTAGRPTAAAAGQGGMIYDTTLSKPIWSDGTAWRDAAGTVV